MRALILFTCCFAVLSGPVSADQESAQWRVEVAQYLDRSYDETAQMVDLFDALLQRNDYIGQLQSESHSSRKSTECGYGFLPFRAAEANGIEFQRTVPVMSEVVTDRTIVIRKRDIPRATSGLILTTYSPTTAKIFWVDDVVLAPDQVVVLRAAFDRMRPLWEALLQRMATVNVDVGDAVSRGGIGFGEPCDGSRSQWPAGAYVTFLDESNRFDLRAFRDESVLLQMSLAQVELLEEVADFMLMGAAADFVYAQPERLFAQLEKAKRRKLESFDDLGLGEGGGQPQGEGRSEEFDDLDLGDLQLDKSTDPEPEPNRW